METRKERPIIFPSTEMVRAILEGRKTQTRRPIKPQPEGNRKITQLHEKDYWSFSPTEDWQTGIDIRCPYGQPGDILWVKETWAPAAWDENGKITHIDYKADIPINAVDTNGWRSPVFMPRWASRIKLKITDVRVERVQDISIKDILAEGIGHIVDEIQFDTEYKTWLRNEFQKLWDSTYAKKGFEWDTNCWVWVIKFKRT